LVFLIHIGTEYFKHGIHSPFYSLQNAVCFIILKYLVPVLFKFYIKGVLKLKKKNNSGAKRLIHQQFALYNHHYTGLKYRKVSRAQSNTKLEKK